MKHNWQKIEETFFLNLREFGINLIPILGRFKLSICCDYTVGEIKEGWPTLNFSYLKEFLSLYNR